MSKKANQIQPKQQRRSSVRWTADEARTELNDWRQSDLTMAAYCRQRGLHVNRLYNWRKRFEEWVAASDQGDAMVAGRQKSLHWIEATVSTQTTPALTLRFGDGGCIEVATPERVEPKWLVQLVRGLSEPALR
jgi:hypothetical protein